MLSYSKVLTITGQHTVTTNLQSVKKSKHLRSTIKQGEPVPQNAPMPPTLSFSEGGSNGCDHNSDSRAHTGRLVCQVQAGGLIVMVQT